MQTFKTVLKITKKQLPSIIMYIGIFLLIACMMASSTEEENDFTSTSLSICVIDEDNSGASRALCSYLETQHEVTKTELTADERMDELYYRSLDYILVISAGYEAQLTSGNTENLFTSYKLPDSYTATFFEAQLTEYVANLSTYLIGGYTLNEAYQKTAELQTDSVAVTIETFAEEASAYGASAYYFYSFLPYILLSIMITALCPVVMTMTGTEIRNRIKCSAVSSTRYMLSIALGISTLVFGIWILFVVVSRILYGDVIFEQSGLLAILNSLVFNLIAAAIALLIASLVHSTKVVSMIANIVGLGMSFLCGVFVPQALLSDGVLTVAKFLPAYWYVKVNDLIGGQGDTTYSTSAYWRYLGIEAIFLAIVLVLIVLVSRKKQKAVKD